jgi:hypothetical protein
MEGQAPVEKRASNPRTHLPVSRLRSVCGLQIHVPLRPRTHASMRHACWLHGSEPRGILGKKQGIGGTRILPRRRVPNQDFSVGLASSEREANKPGQERQSKTHSTLLLVPPPSSSFPQEPTPASKLARPHARRASFKS